MGIRHQPLRERQHHSTTRWNKNRDTTQQDQRRTATTSSTASWTDHELHRDQSSHPDPGLLQDDFSFLKIDFSSWHELQWRICGGKETTKAKEKAKASTKEAKAKASTGAKDTTRDLKKINRGSYKKGGYNKSTGKCYSGSKG